jgi:mannose-6-phosphate isomerase-like protein (cupin superfamily)
VGRLIENPATGERIRFLEAAGASPDALRIDYFCQPRTPRLDHIHPRLEERITVVGGHLGFQIHGAPQQELVAGDVVVAPPGIAHALWNTGQEEAQVVAEFTPALHIADLFSTVFGLAADGKTNSKGIPNLLQVAVIGQSFREEFTAASPPPAVQRVVFAVLAPLARRLGYHATYARYGAEDT